MSSDPAAPVADVCQCAVCAAMRTDPGQPAPARSPIRDVAPIRMEDVGWLSYGTRTILQYEAEAMLRKLAQRARDIADRLLDGRMHSTVSGSVRKRYGWRGFLCVQQVGATLTVRATTRVGDGHHVLFILRPDGSFGVLCAPSTDGVPDYPWDDMIEHALDYEVRDDGDNLPNPDIGGGHLRSVWSKSGPDGWCHGRFRVEDIAIAAWWLDDTLHPEAPSVPDRDNDLKRLNVRAE